MKEDIEKQAIEFIKKNKKLLFEKYTNDSICKAESKPLSVFMAGSPGAGKTEFSKSLIKKDGIKAVRIDADEIRDMIPQYTGQNTDQVKRATIKGVELLQDFVLKNKKSMILDGTFTNYQIAKLNIERSLEKERIVEIYYIYQTPLIAWKFTKAREKIEGRKVPKGFFVQALFNAKRNVERIKNKFREKVKIHVVVKNYQHKIENFWMDVSSIDPYVKIQYTKDELIKKL